MKRTLLFSLVLAAGLAAAHTAWDSAPDGNPLLRYALDQSARFGFTGHVEERLPAGSYLYLRVRDPAGVPHWVATLTSTAATTDEVKVQVFARAEDFHSKRLDRDFSQLLFGTVRPATSPSR